MLDTLEAVATGKIAVQDLPQITLLTDGQDHYFSLNNRRLFVFKELEKRGLLPRGTVTARVRLMPKTRRLEGKYSTETCALTASLIRERPGGDDAAAAVAQCGLHQGRAADDSDESAEVREEDGAEEAGGCGSSAPPRSGANLHHATVHGARDGLAPAIVLPVEGAEGNALRRTPPMVISPGPPTNANRSIMSSKAAAKNTPTTMKPKHKKGSNPLLSTPLPAVASSVDDSGEDDVDDFHGANSRQQRGGGGNRFATLPTRR